LVPVRVAALAAVVAIVLPGCGGGSSHTAAPAPATTAIPSTTASSSTAPSNTGVASAPGKKYEHVVWIWMENHTFGQVIGNSSAPYETGLARQFGSATHYASVGSPSLPNYIGATSGSAQGISDDAGPQSHPLTADNVFRQVRDAGGAERSFEESMPTNCALNTVDAYAVRHNPAAYYVGADDRAACRTDDVPFSGPLPSGALPTFSFVTPNLCDDTHDCSVAAGDVWLKSFIPPLLGRPEYKAGTTAIFVTWDEYTPMPDIIISPTTPAGTVVTERLDHYSLLRTTEELLGLRLLGRAATATSVRGAFHL
jgi:phosphatidylinositol-3-phosphatase